MPHLPFSGGRGQTSEAAGAVIGQTTGQHLQRSTTEGIHQTMPQRNYVDSEHSLRDRIHIAFASSPMRWCKGVQFETRQGQVVLKGVVQTYYQKQLAQESIRAVRGVEQVCNEIQVVS